ncbi:MAG: FAD:protein FMN transferase [Magnetococcales bacterium]|nr:FAD:protein FMN transferase [Magnetococcales bacterium]
MNRPLHASLSRTPPPSRVQLFVQAGISRATFLNAPSCHWVLILLLPMLLLTGCSDPPSSRATTRMLMGTLVTITTWGASDEMDQKAVTAAFQEMARIEAAMSRHQGTSQVSQINKAPRGSWQEITLELFNLIQQGLRVQKESDQAFYMGLGELAQLWGFSKDPPPTKPPEPQALNDWVAHGALDETITLKESRQLRLAHTVVALDLGAIAKGYAIDQAMTVLEKEGIENAIVNAGGDLRVLGSKGDTPWKIGIRHPRNAQGVAAVSRLTGELAMVTSGDYERFFIHEGIRYHHLLDPKTGKPARSGLISVSIQAPTATLADALATAFFVLGGESGLKLLEKFPRTEALFITDSGEHHQTPGFQGSWQADP